MEIENKIYFYGVNNNYDYLSNFYKCKFECFINNNIIIFNCSEQYFVYYKCLIFDSSNIKLLNNILEEMEASKIKALGRKVKNFDKNIWDLKKYNIMLNALYYKFSQNIIIKEKLLNTYDKILYEAAPRDKIWGIGFSAKKAITIDTNKYGNNLLGIALIELRNKFKLQLI